MVFKIRTKKPGTKKERIGMAKLILVANSAKPGSSVSPYLAPKGYSGQVNDFCKIFNSISNELVTKLKKIDDKLLVEIFLYPEKKFEVKVKGMSFFNMVKKYLSPERVLSREHLDAAIDLFIQQKEILSEIEISLIEDLEIKSLSTSKLSDTQKKSIRSYLTNSLNSCKVKIGG